MVIVELVSRNQVHLGANKKAHPRETEEELGLWVDARIISKHLKQPSQSTLSQRASADSLLHFADLALGSIRPDKFKPERVSKKREK